MKRLKCPDDARDVRLLQAFRHNSFHGMLECFSFEGAYYVLFEHVPISLAHLAKSPPFLSELELAAMLGPHRVDKALEHCITLMQRLRPNIPCHYIHKCSACDQIFLATAYANAALPTKYSLAGLHILLMALSVVLGATLGSNFNLKTLRIAFGVKQQ